LNLAQWTLGIMIVSLNEIESLALEAAHGAGFAWGLAEEVGFAARWLAAYDLDAVGAVDSLLADAASACGVPLRTVASAARLADERSAALPATIVEPAAPLLLVPFVAALDEAMQRPLALSWPGARIVVAPEPGGSRPAATSAPGVSIVRTSRSPTQSRPPQVACRDRASACSTTRHGADCRRSKRAPTCRLPDCRARRVPGRA
jgi:hypothetical protein